MCMLNTLLHQSSMQEIDLFNPQLDPRISYTGGPKWYHGPDGLLRESLTNFLTFSEFPNGVTDAPSRGGLVSAVSGLGWLDRLWTGLAFGHDGVSTTFAYKSYATTIGITYNFSFYMVMDDGGVPVPGATTGSGDFRVLIAGSLVPVGDIEVELVSGTVYRVNATLTATTSSLSNGIVKYSTQSSRTFKVTGYQLVKGTAPGRYIATTTTSNSDWPVEYDPITLEPLGRSVWEQRVNLLTWSDQFGAWNKLQATVSADVVTAPDGTMSGDVMLLSVSGSFCALDSSVTMALTTGTTYTISKFLKAGPGVNHGALSLGASRLYGVFDLVNGVVLHAKANGADFNNASGTIQNVGNGWYRCTLTGTSLATTSHRARIALSDGSDSQAPNITGTVGVTGLYVWGAQGEQAGYPGPYIPTSTSQVTRFGERADVASIDSVRFNQARGQSVLIEYQYAYAHNHTLMQVYDEDANLDTDWLIYSNNNPTSFIARMYGGPTGVSGAHFGGLFSSNVGALNKGIVAADQTSTGGTINGQTPVSNTNCIPPTSGLRNIRIGQVAGGSSNLDGHMRRIVFWPTKLTPDQQQAVTV